MGTCRNCSRPRSPTPTLPIWTNSSRPCAGRRSARRCPSTTSPTRLSSTTIRPPTPLLARSHAPFSFFFFLLFFCFFSLVNPQRLSDGLATANPGVLVPRVRVPPRLCADHGQGARTSHHHHPPSSGVGVPPPPPHLTPVLLFFLRRSWTRSSSGWRSETRKASASGSRTSPSRWRTRFLPSSRSILCFVSLVVSLVVSLGRARLTSLAWWFVCCRLVEQQAVEWGVFVRAFYRFLKVRPPRGRRLVQSKGSANEQLRYPPSSSPHF